MHTYETLLQDLEKTNIRKNGTLMIHSSYKSLGDVEGRAETVLDALIDYMQDGLLLFPTHSWSPENLQDGLYDPQTEPACVGILPNLFMKREGAIRSMHPTHSVTAIGDRAQEYTSYDVEAYTPCPRHGCFGRLYDENAQILFLGVGLVRNTFIHALEEWMNIPDRINPNPRTIRVKYEDRIEEIKLQGHHSSVGGVHYNYDKLLQPMLDMEIAREVKIGDSTSYVVEVQPMADWVLGLLKDNPQLFSDKTPVPAQMYEKI